MIQKILKLSVLILMVLMLGTSMTHASGKMEVRLKEKVTIKAGEIGTNATYKWIVKKGKDIINTQASTLFTYEFEQAGEYEVNLTTTDGQGNIHTTSVVVMAGQKFARPGEEGQKKDTAAFTLTTLPPLVDGRVHVINDSTVLFSMQGGPDILEYRVDQNIFKDSNNNGTANDDIDNASHDSYLRGGNWQAQYDVSTSTKVVAEVTAVAWDGKKTRQQVEIVFDAVPAQDASPLAVFYTNPAPNPDDQIIYLYGEEAEVGFYAEESPGSLIEYRVDKNIFFDSDGDGDPANDIDNLNHPSFTTGDIWTTTYKKTDGQIIAQLIVVGADGKGSRVQRAIKFSDRAAVKLGDESSGIRLVADKSFVLKGDPIQFSVQGLSLSLDEYTFQWDFDGDGFEDKQIEASNTAAYLFEEPGTFNVTVQVTDRSGNTGQFNLEMPVRDTVQTTADFGLTMEGNTIHFIDKSTVAQNLSNKTLQYQWNFGDTDEEAYEEQKGQISQQNPSYTYYNEGTYLATLTVTDADNVTGSSTSEVVIEKSIKHAKKSEGKQADKKEEKPKEAQGEGSSLVVKILKVMLYLVVVVLALVLLLLGGFIVFLKVQHPDLVFDELVDELKVKILAILGMDEDVETVREVASPKAPQTPQEPEDSEMADKEVIEGEIEEEAPVSAPEPMPAQKPTPAPEPPASENDPITPPPAPGQSGAPLDNPDGPVPDWLKGV